MKQLWRGIYVCLCIHVVTLNHLNAQAGGVKPPRYLAAYDAFIKSAVLPKRTQQAMQLEATLKSQIPQWFPEGEAEPGKRWDNFHGASLANVFATNLQDSALSLGADWYGANKGGLLSPFIMAIAPYTKFFPKVRTPLPGCEIRSQMRYLDWGTCITGAIVVPLPWAALACGPTRTIFFTTSLAEYRWPADKQDMSRQPYQSLYYEKNIVENVYMPGNDLEVLPLAAQNASNLINEVAQRRQTEENLEKSIFGEGEAAPLPPAAKPDREAINLIKKFDKKFRHTAPSGDGLGYAYGRFLPENANIMTAVSGIWKFVPHVPKYAWLGQDQPFSWYGLNGNALVPTPTLFSGWQYSKFFNLSALWTQRFLSMMVPFGQWQCISNNKWDGKTPFDVLGGLPLLASPSSGYSQYDRRRAAATFLPPPLDNRMGNCIDKVGEEMMNFEHTRPHATDATFQAMWRANIEWRTFADMMQGRFHGQLNEPRDDEHDERRARTAMRHLFQRKQDLYRFFHRSNDFDKETKKFAKIDELPKLNVEYNQGNINTVGKGFEQSAMRWPFFKGCFGRRGGYGSPMKGDYPWAVWPNVSPYGYGGMPNRLSDSIKLY